MLVIRGSRHVPPPPEAVTDAMSALQDLLENEPKPILRAVLSHWLFGFIHPYMDGNGRMARFLMNLMMASGGYPWTIVRTTRRKEYLDALEAASADQTGGRKESPGQVNSAERDKNRALGTDQVLALLQQHLPEQYQLAEIVGRWVWIIFPEPPAEQLRGQLSQFGSSVATPWLLPSSPKTVAHGPAMCNHAHSAR